MYMLKHIRDDDLLPAMEKVINPLEEIANNNFVYLKTIFRYIVDRGQTTKPGNCSPPLLYNLGSREYDLPRFDS
jgi:hypothetical protein